MKRFFVSLIAVCSLFTLADAQAKAEGGYIIKDLTGTYSTYNQEQALNSMADWYTMKVADSTTLGSVSTKYGSSYRLKQIYNNSGSVQKIKVKFVGTTDSVTINLNSYSASGKLPSVSRIISGAVVDSTIYFFQRN